MMIDLRIHFNVYQRDCVWFRCVRTNIAKRNKPKVQQQRFSERKIRSNERYTLLCVVFNVVKNQ